MSQAELGEVQAEQFLPLDGGRNMREMDYGDSCIEQFHEKRDG